MSERLRNRDLFQKERRLLRGASAHPDAYRFILGYPNRYWIAMSNLGFQTVYRLIAGDPRFAIERAYLPEVNREVSWEGDQRFRQEQRFALEDGGVALTGNVAEIRSFESNLPLSSADILALSVSFETDYPAVLSFVEQAGVDLASRRETAESRYSPVENDNWHRPFILGGGAALTLNPEPLANFFDAIVIGEGEEVLSEITELYCLARRSAEPFSSFLQKLAGIEGVYVPSFFRPLYQENGSISAFESSALRPVRRYLKDLDRFPTTTAIQTPETEFKSMFMTETGRGCEVGCRFCVAGYMYRPIRKRSEDVLRDTVQLGVESSESIGFVGAAVSSHPAISRLASSVAGQGKRAALSSIMSQRVTSELAESLSESEYKTVALAPEAGSEELRFRVGKRVCDDQIVQAVATLARNGIRNIKLYFMVGLPSESDSDVDAIPALVKRLRESALNAARQQDNFSVAPRLFLSVNPFIPKAWTPFQWFPFGGFTEMRRKLNRVRVAVRRIPNVTMGFESPRESYFQAVISRGDRRVGDLLCEMRRRGEDWRWLVRNGSKQLLDGVPACDFYVLRSIPTEELLPWEVVDLQLRRSLLEREYRRTFEEDITPLIARAKRELVATSGKTATGMIWEDCSGEKNSVTARSAGGQEMCL